MPHPEVCSGVYKAEPTEGKIEQTLPSYLPDSQLAPFSINMQVAAILLVCLAVANAAFIPPTTFVRTPAFDSAIIKSDRLGGNFAYSTVEGHAYAAVSPVVRNVLTPVGVSQRVIPAPYFGYAGPQFVAAPAAVDPNAYPGYPLYVA